MHYDNLPIFKSALDLVAYVETIVKGFEKYHKYTLGEDLRQQSKEILFAKLKGTDIALYEMLTVLHRIVWQDATQDVVLKGNKKSFEYIPSHKTLFKLPKLPKHKGLPIGNLTSQFFANVYMDCFDNFVKRKLKVKRYLRYVDDFVLFAQSKEELMNHYEKIVIYLEKELELRLRDTYILRENKEGLDFLGYVIRPHYTLVRRRVVNNFKQKKAQYLQLYESQKGKMKLLEIKQFLSVKASFEGHAKHANSYKLLKKVGYIDETNPFNCDRA